MNPRKRSTQTKILNALIGGLTLTSSVQAQDYDDYNERVMVISDSTGQTNYEFRTSHSDFTAPFEQFADGACGVLTNVTSVPVHFDVIQTLQDNYGTLARGAGQIVQNGTEACLKLMLPKDVTDHIQKIESDRDETLSLALTVIGIAIGVGATFFAAIFFMVLIRRLYARTNALTHTPVQAIQQDDHTPLLGDIEQPLVLAAPSQPSEPARKIKTFAERWETIEKTAKAEGKQIKAPNDFRCPITLEIMEHPVCDVKGHSYEEDAIKNWLQSSNKSPATGEILPNKTLIANHSLRGAIEEFLQTCERDFNLTCYADTEQTVEVKDAAEIEETCEAEERSSFKMGGSF